MGPGLLRRSYVAVSRKIFYGLAEGGSVSGAGVTSGNELAVLAGQHNLVVMLDDKEPCKLVPTLHHLICISDSLVGIRDS